MIRYSLFLLPFLLTGCIALPSSEPLEIALKHGQTRMEIVDCLGQPDALMQVDGTETWLYGLTQESVETFRNTRGRYNLTDEKHEKNMCKMQVVWGEVFAEKYLIQSTKRGVLGDHACYSKLRKCAPKH